MKHGPLTRKERRVVEERAAHAADPKALRRAPALLWREKGESARAVAERLGVSRRTGFNWVARCHARQEVDIPRRLGDGSRSDRPRTAASIIDPLLDHLIDSAPRTLGYRTTVWTAPLVTNL